ncbi:MarC family protein [Sphingomonas sp. 10B4]|uniref:MarC family protein n=1 Tax=Sphingomonas sp. 10B4 TaxID=3048575 RepID=UPI002AB36BBE|nr:MarC family protein [Sphingomonas sp. 10B4]MDY7523638.1 MarC family protein [Sphingomonas sp. 10B4]MEB0283962.1 MarC family protein [Sphingomonas sp. 10B4]
MSVLDTSALVTMTVGLFAITAPIAVLPLFVAATAGQTQGDQRRTALVSAATYVVAGLLALFVGNAALGVFGVSIAALRVAGMAVIGVIGWQMLNAPTPTEATPVRSHHHRASNTHVPVAAHNAVAPSPTSVGILPLGFPIYAGPGVLSVIIAWGSGSRPVYLAAMVAILANAAIIVALDFLAAPITRVIGEKALLITEKIFGLLVVAIAVGGMASALVALFPGLGGR